MKYEKIKNNFIEKQKLIKYAKENKINNYSEIIDYCIKNKYEWFKLIIDTPNLKKYFNE